MFKKNIGVNTKVYTPNVEASKNDTGKVVSPKTSQSQGAKLSNQLDYMGKVNMSQVSFGSESPKTYAGYELNFSEEELEKKIDKQTNTIKLLAADSPEYNNLAEGDKQALKHLVKASSALNDAFLKQDNEINMELKAALTNAAQAGDTKAEKALKLFNSLNGVMGVDRTSNMTVLVKGIEEKPGINFYPSDITEEKFHSTLKNMLKAGQRDEVQQILNARSIVKNDGENGLKSVDFVDEFQGEFAKAADELEKAAQTSTNDDFNKYLMAQAAAFRTPNPELDCEADRLWAQLQDTPLEFTVSRENYDDNFTGTVFNDKELNELIEQNKIEVNPKDALGIRVGIINKEGTKEVLDFKKYLPALAELMPYKDQYTQSISSNEEDIKQTMVDADIVALAGDQGAYRGGITIAENLPNDDKLSVKRGYGRRNVYHRQVRLGGNPEKMQKRLDAILDKDLHKYFDKNADHRFTIGHENAHSLGPTALKASLGTWNNIVEESKADMGSIASLDYLTECGKYNEFEKKQILVSWAESNLLKAKPQLTQAHRVRSVMQLNCFIEKGALDLDKDGVLHVNMEKMVPTAQSMLKDVVGLQLSQSPEKAEEYVNKYFVWTENMQKCADKISEVDDSLYGKLESPLAEKLLSED